MPDWRVETWTWLRRGWKGFHLAPQAGGTNLPMTGPPPPPPLPPGVKAPCLKHVGNMFEASPNWDIADTELDPSLFGKPIEDSRFSVSDFDVGVFNVCCDYCWTCFCKCESRESVSWWNIVTTCRESTLIPFRPWVSPQRCRAHPPWVPARFGIPVASDMERQVEQVIDPGSL